MAQLGEEGALPSGGEDDVANWFHDDEDGDEGSAMMQVASPREHDSTSLMQSAHVLAHDVVEKSELEEDAMIQMSVGSGGQEPTLRMPTDAELAAEEDDGASMLQLPNFKQIDAANKEALGITSSGLEDGDMEYYGGSEGTVMLQVSPAREPAGEAAPLR